MSKKSLTPDDDRSTKDRILAAALSAFGELGFDGTTTVEIAKRAGVNEVTIFRLFKNKEELFQSVLRSNFPIAEFASQLQFDPSRPIDEVLKENTSKILGILRNNRDKFSILISELPKRPHPECFAQFVMKNVVIAPLNDYLRTLMDDGRLRNVDPEVASRSLFGMVQAYFLFNYVVCRSNGDKELDERFVDGFVDIFLNGMRSEAI